MEEAENPIKSRQKNNLMAHNAMLEEDLMKHLSDSGLEKDVLKKHSAALAAVSRSLILERIWWKGTPWPDFLTVQGRLPLERISELGTVINNNIYGLEVFPLGLINPEALQVNINFQLNNSSANR